MKIVLHTDDSNGELQGITLEHVGPTGAAINHQHKGPLPRAALELAVWAGPAVQEAVNARVVEDLIHLKGVHPSRVEALLVAIDEARTPLPERSLASVPLSDIS